MPNKRRYGPGGPSAAPHTHVQVVVVATGTVWRHGLVFAAAEVEAATEAATAAVAARHDGAHDEHRLAGRRGDHEVGVDILLAKLLGDVQAQRAIVVVDVPLRLVAQNGMGPVHLLELKRVAGSVYEEGRVGREGRLPCRTPLDCPGSCRGGISGLAYGRSS